MSDPSACRVNSFELGTVPVDVPASTLKEIRFNTGLHVTLAFPLALQNGSVSLTGLQANPESVESAHVPALPGPTMSRRETTRAGNPTVMSAGTAIPFTETRFQVPIHDDNVTVTA